MWCFQDSSCEYRIRRCVILTSSKNKSSNSIYGEYITGERHVRSNYILWARIVCQGSHCTGGCPDISQTLVFKDGYSTGDVAALAQQPHKQRGQIYFFMRFITQFQTAQVLLFLLSRFIKLLRLTC